MPGLTAISTGLQSALAEVGASLFAPGLFPTDPINPGQSENSPGALFRSFPVDPISPGAQGYTPGHLFRDIPSP